MKFNVKIIPRTFTAAEAETITGASMVLQRDWRRRGLLATHKGGTGVKVRFTIGELIELAVKKAFADAGFPVSSISDVARMAILPTEAFLYDIPNALVFEGENIPDDLKQDVIENTIVGASGRFLLMASDMVTGKTEASRWADYEKLTEFLRDGMFFTWTILDCTKLGFRIATRAGLPLVRVVVTDADEDNTDPDVADRDYLATVRKAAKRGVPARDIAA